MKNTEEWADLNGEIPMSRSQAEREEERERRRREERDAQEFTLRLTAAELDWLLFDLMDWGMGYYEDGSVYSEKIRAQRNMWWAQADAQNYQPF